MIRDADFRDRMPASLCTKQEPASLRVSIMDRTAMLSKSVAELHAALNILSDRLDPVLAGGPESDVEKPNASIADTALEEALGDVQGSLVSVMRRVQSLIDRLRL